MAKTTYKLFLIATFFYIQAPTGCGGSCTHLDCWFVRDKPGGGVNHEKTLLHIRTSRDTRHTQPEEKLTQASTDTPPDRVYHVTDLSASLCHSSLHSPSGSLIKPKCEINVFHPLPSDVQWAATLTDSAFSPTHLQSDWLSMALLGLEEKLALATVMRVPTATREANVVLRVLSKTVSVQCRLGKPVMLDCQFWVDPSSPLSASGFSVEWRYQFRGDGHLVVGYDGKADRLADSQEEGFQLDFAGLHERGNASLVLQEATAHHSGTYICAVHLPYLQAQVAVELEVVEPPSLSITPATLPLVVSGQVLSVKCEASGFVPLSLKLDWELTGADGETRLLGSGSVSGHRRAWDGTYIQSSSLELDTSSLGVGGELACVAMHQGGTRRSRVALNVIGFSTPSIEDSMAMVAVALVLYGIIKLAFWNITGSDEVVEQKEKNQ